MPSQASNLNIHPVLALLLLMPFAQPGFSQQADDKSGTAPGVIEEIIVTATKREASIQDVPLSMAALSGQDLERLGADDFTDYLGTVAGVSFTSSGNGSTKIAIRGITDGPDILTSPVTGIYFDETPIAFSGLDPDIRLVDVARVEVLRGPQGTLYGAGSMGGTIKFITNKPDPTSFGVYINATLSSTHKGSESYLADAVLNVPVVEDQSAIRLVAYYRDEGGYIDDIGLGIKDVNDIETKGARLSWATQFTDSFRASLNFIYEDTKSGGYLNDDLVTPILTMSKVKRETSERKFKQVSLVLDWDLGFADLQSTSAYFEHDVLNNLDVTPLAIALGLLTGVTPVWIETYWPIENFVEEIRLTSNSDGRFNWLLGGFYSTRDRGVEEILTATDYDMYSPFPFPLGDTLNDLSGSNDKNQLAFFGELSFEITPRLTLTGGLRWAEYKLTTWAQQTSFLLGDRDDPPQSFKEDTLNPSLSLAYEINDDAMVYVRAAKGFRPGEVQDASIEAFCADDIAALGLPGLPDAKSDSLWSYELGAKATLAGGALQLTGAAYKIDWKDILVRVGLPCGLNPFLNAGGGESKGFELEFTAVPVEGLEFYGGVAYTDATITEGAFLVGALEGESMPNVPEWSFSLGGRYSFPLSDRLNAFIGANLQYVDDTESNFSQIGSIPLDSYTLVRASAGISWDKWALEIFADNITDSRAALAAAFGVATDSLMRIRPRTIGLTLRARY